MRPPIDHSTVLLTGASAGIGRELARLLAPRVNTLVLVARRRDRLEALRAELQSANPRLNVYLAPYDLADPAAVEALLVDVAQAVDPIDILINNAGVGDQALYDQADWGRIQRMIAINTVAVARLTHGLVPAMVARHRGGILTISSGAGIALVPGAAAYTGTKHFVTGLMETLYAELADTGVVVTQVCPGPVDTEFDAAAGITGMAGGPPQAVRISAEQCAREALRGFERGQPLVFPGLAYGAMMLLLGLVPRVVRRQVARRTARRIRSASQAPGMGASASAIPSSSP
jgi:uncharacterized protein